MASESTGNVNLSELIVSGYLPGLSDEAQNSRLDKSIKELSTIIKNLTKCNYNELPDLRGQLQHTGVYTRDNAFSAVKKKTYEIKRIEGLSATWRENLHKILQALENVLNRNVTNLESEVTRRLETLTLDNLRKINNKLTKISTLLATLDRKKFSTIICGYSINSKKFAKEKQKEMSDLIENIKHTIDNLSNSIERCIPQKNEQNQESKPLPQSSSSSSSSSSSCPTQNDRQAGTQSSLYPPISSARSSASSIITSEIPPPPPLPPPTNPFVVRTEPPSAEEQVKIDQLQREIDRFDQEVLKGFVDAREELIKQFEKVDEQSKIYTLYRPIGQDTLPLSSNIRFVKTVLKKYLKLNEKIKNENDESKKDDLQKKLDELFIRTYMFYATTLTSPQGELVTRPLSSFKEEFIDWVGKKTVRDAAFQQIEIQEKEAKKRIRELENEILQNGGKPTRQFVPKQRTAASSSSSSSSAFIEELKRRQESRGNLNKV